MAKRIKKPAPPEYPKVFETFNTIGSWELRNLKRDAPSCFNGYVEVKKYRVTIEEVEEPVEVIHARLQKMWDECDNWHHWDPLRSTAAKYGYELQGSAGSKKNNG